MVQGQLLFRSAFFVCLLCWILDYTINTQILDYTINIHIGLPKVSSKLGHEQRTYWYAWFRLIWGTQVHFAVDIEKSWLICKAEHTEGEADHGTLAISTNFTHSPIFKYYRLIIRTPG